MADLISSGCPAKTPQWSIVEDEAFARGPAMPNRTCGLHKSTQRRTSIQASVALRVESRRRGISTCVSDLKIPRLRRSPGQWQDELDSRLNVRGCNLQSDVIEGNRSTISRFSTNQRPAVVVELHATSTSFHRTGARWTASGTSEWAAQRDYVLAIDYLEFQAIIVEQQSRVTA